MMPLPSSGRFESGDDVRDEAGKLFLRDEPVAQDIFDILRRSLRQYFQALKYVIQWTENPNLPCQLEWTDIQDLGIDLDDPDWQRIAHSVEIHEKGRGIRTVYPQRDGWTPPRDTSVTLHRILLAPGIHGMIYTRLYESITVAWYLLREWDILPNAQKQPPWYVVRGIAITHADDLLLILKQTPMRREDLLAGLMEAKRKSLCMVDRVRHTISAA